MRLKRCRKKAKPSGGMPHGPKKGYGEDVDTAFEGFAEAFL